MTKKQTFWDVEYATGGCANGSPLRRPEAESLAKRMKEQGFGVKIVPTHDKLWEKTYGDK